MFIRLCNAQYQNSRHFTLHTPFTCFALPRWKFFWNRRCYQSVISHDKISQLLKNLPVLNARNIHSLASFIFIEGPQPTFGMSHSSLSLSNNCVIYAVWMLQSVTKPSDNVELLLQRQFKILVQTRCVWRRYASKQCGGDPTRSTRAEKVRWWRSTTVSHRSAILELRLLLAA